MPKTKKTHIFRPSKDRQAYNHALVAYREACIEASQHNLELSSDARNAYADALEAWKRCPMCGKENEYGAIRKAEEE